MLGETIESNWGWGGDGVEGSAIKNTEAYFPDFNIYKYMSKGLSLAELGA